MSTEHLARMGEQVVSAVAGDVLACVGLGSCIGLALIDRRADVAGLAHIMLPEAPAGAPASGKHADVAVPALLDAVLAAGGARHRLDAVIVGGAAMFSFGGSTGSPAQEIGRRNEEAVRRLLTAQRLHLRAEAVGGTRGRTMRVRIGQGVVTVKEAGGRESVLFGSADAAGLRRAA
ncbi:chemotaxis protein CheD [Paraconexibacter sp.]|uniref:chemotaxis protein CheD n=1 Tax=Paraconexibacter sp. TaxID=2949640 RepID=UPI003562604E